MSRCALVLACAASPVQAADAGGHDARLTRSAVADDHMTWSWIGRIEHTDTAARPPFVAGLFERTYETREAALLVDARTAGVAWRARGVSRESRADFGATRTTRFDLLDVSTAHALGPNGLVTLGKTRLEWDVGVSARPVGAFQPATDPADLDDRDGRTEGLPLIALAWLGTSFDATLAYARATHGTAHTPEQVGLQLAGRDDRLAWAAIVHRPAGRASGLGGTLAWTVSDAWVVHASALARQHDAFASVVGATFGRADGSSVVAEWAHDDAGMSRSRWRALRTRIAMDAHAWSLAPDDPHLAARLYADADVFARAPARRDAVFVQWRSAPGTLEATPFVQWQAGGGWVWNLSGQWRIARSLALGVSWTRFGGRADAPLSHAPLDGVARVSLRASY